MKIDSDLIFILFWISLFIYYGHLQDLIIVLILILGVILLIIKTFFIKDLFLSLVKWIINKYILKRSY